MHTLPDSCSSLFSYSAFCSASESASGDSGDYYEIAAPHSGELLIGMGSIAVEGPAGPILTRGLHAHLGSLLSRGVKASYCASELNRTLWDVAPEHTFSGVFIAHIDSAASRMDYVNAGHEAALVIRAAGSFERLEPHAPILGLSRRSEYRERTIRFSSGDALIVLSEGAGEAAERLLRGGVPEITRELAAKIVDAGDACRDRTAILIHNTSHRFAMVA